MAGTLEYLWLDVQSNGVWIPNPVAPDPAYLQNIQDFRLVRFTDADGNYRQARSVAGFAWQGFFATQNGSPPVNAPVVDPYRELPISQSIPDPTGSVWPSFVGHCDNIFSPGPVLTPTISDAGSRYKGLYTLGNVARTVEPMSDVSPCLGAGDNCVSYFQGPMKLGYLYGIGSDQINNLPHTLTLDSLGNCRWELRGELPYAYNFTNIGAQIPDNAISARVPSESFIFLDGARVVRFRPVTWYAVYSDSAHPNQFSIPDFYMYSQNLEYWDNPRVEGPDPKAPWYQSGQAWYTFDDKGERQWTNTLQHAGGQSYWQKRWFDENPAMKQAPLDMIVKTWYLLPNPDPNDPVDDPYPDPWSVGIDEYIKGKIGTRPPDDCLFVPGTTVTTTVAGGDETYQVQPTYSNVPGFTWPTSRAQYEIRYVHAAYYCGGVVVGQSSWYNLQAGSDYFPFLCYQNQVVTPPDPNGQTYYYPSCANLDIYPYGALGEDIYPRASVNLVSRNGLTGVFAAVYPTNLNQTAVIDFGDGSTPAPVVPLGQISHTYRVPGEYTVKITLSGLSSKTVYQFLNS